MDWKSIGSKELKNEIFLFYSNIQFPFSVLGFPDDAKDTLEPSHRLSARYSRLRSQQPRNDAPNISVSVGEILFEEAVKFAPLVSSLNYSHSLKVNIQHVYEHGLYSQHPLEFEHFNYCRSELSNHGFAVGYRLVEHDSDISSPKPDEPTFYLHYGLSCDNPPYCKTMKLIETKLAAMKLQGFNH